MKKCKSGYYYCNTDKKCKPIPRGYRVGYGGYLRKEKDDDDSKNKSNGNGNGNGNGSHGNGNGGNGSGGNGGGGNGGGMGEEITYEAKMTEKEKKKKEEIVMSMKKKKKDFEDRYGEDGKSVMYATATKLAMGEALNSDDKPAIKELIKKLKGSAKAHKQQSKDLEVAMKTEGSLHKWFKGSKSKDGKGGWVNVVTGGTCASDEPGEGTPKCVSSSKRASMSKSERLSAARRKKKADPGQQSKSGAAKPTYVSTDSPRKKKKMKKESTELLEMGVKGDKPIKVNLKKLTDKVKLHLDIDLRLLPGISKDHPQNFFTILSGENVLEHKLLLIWNRSQSFRVLTGYKLVTGQYPYGHDMRLLPYIPLLETWIPIAELQWAKK